MDNIFDFAHYTQSLHEWHQEYVELVPIKALWDMREFDRREEPKWSQERTDMTIDNLKDDVEREGFKNPIRIEYYFYAGKATIREGNHRVRAAFELGLQYVPALVYVSDSSFKKNAAHLDMPSFPRTIGRDDLEPFYRPSQLNISGCMNLDGEPVSADIEWAHDLIEQFEEDEPEPIAFKTIKGQITDATVSTLVSVVYDMSNRHDAEKLYALFARGYADYMQRNAVQYVRRDLTEYANEKEWRNVFISHFEAGENPGDMLGTDYRNYLIRLLVSNPATNVSPTSAAGLSDMELVYELEDHDAYNDVCASLYKTFYDEWATRSAERMVTKFYHYYFDFVHGGDFNLENYRLNTVDEIILEFDSDHLNKFQHLQEDDTSMKDILVREFKKEAFSAKYEAKRGNEYYAYLDKTFTFDNIKTALKKLVK